MRQRHEDPLGVVMVRQRQRSNIHAATLGRRPERRLSRPPALLFLFSGATYGRVEMNWRSITDDKEKYAAYLCSREWSVLKEAVRERSDNTCERCRILPMNACHHLTYARKYKEQLEDLQAICTACHEFTHGKFWMDPAPNWKWLEYLSRLNGLEPFPFSKPPPVHRRKVASHGHVSHTRLEQAF